MPNWIVVIGGPRPGVYENWIYAKPFMKDGATCQGFSTEEKARIVWREHLEQIARLANASTPDSDPPSDDEVESTHSETDHRATETSSLADFQEAFSESRNQSPGRLRVSLGYPRDKQSAYIRPSGIRLGKQKASPANTTDIFPFLRSSIDSCEVSLCGDEGQTYGQSEMTDRGAPQLGPLPKLEKLNVEEICSVSRHRPSPRMAEVKPIRKAALQKRNTAGLNGSAPPATREALKPETLAEDGLPNVTVARGSPSRRQTPRQLKKTDSPSKSRTSTRFVEEPRPDSVSGSSLSQGELGSPSPKVSRSRSKLPTSAV